MLKLMLHHAKRQLHLYTNTSSLNLKSMLAKELRYVAAELRGSLIQGFEPLSRVMDCLLDFNLQQLNHFLVFTTNTRSQRPKSGGSTNESVRREDTHAQKEDVKEVTELGGER